jgi:MFS family permease
MSDRLGRRASLMLWCNVLNIIADLMMALSWTGAKAILPLFILGRFLSGANAGMVYVLLPIYITEVFVYFNS